jgi:hypothetical protein
MKMNKKLPTEQISGKSGNIFDYRNFPLQAFKKLVQLVLKYLQRGKK